MTTSPTPASVDVEAAVVAIFDELLQGNRSLDGDSDFFVFGGDSMVAIRMVARLREQFGVRITLRDVFTARTPAELANVISARTDLGGRLGRPVP